MAAIAKIRCKTSPIAKTKNQLRDSMALPGGRGRIAWNMQLQEGRKIDAETAVFAMNRDDHDARLPSLTNCPLELKQQQNWYYSADAGSAFL